MRLLLIIIASLCLIHEVQAQQEEKPIIRTSNIRNSFLNHGIGLFYPKLNLIRADAGIVRQSILGVRYSLFTRKSTSIINWELSFGGFGYYFTLGESIRSNQRYQIMFPSLNLRIKPSLKTENFEVLLGVNYQADLNKDFQVLESNFSIFTGITFALGKNKFWKHIYLDVRSALVFGKLIEDKQTSNLAYSIDFGFQINIFTRKKVFKTDEIEK